MKDHHPADNEHPQGQKEAAHEQPVISGCVTINLSHDLREQRKTERGEDTTHNKKQLRWTKITAGLVFIYALLTFWLGWSSKRAADSAQEAADIAKKTMVIDQRAWLFVDNVFTHTPTEELEVDKPFYIRVTFKNSGENPSYKCASNGVEERCPY